MATRKRTSKRTTKIAAPMGTFERIHQILGDIVDEPVHEKLEGLLAFASKEPDNPAPLLVAVMVVSIARENHLEADKWLAEARDRLVRANSHDPEMAFAAALYGVIEAELGLLALHGHRERLHEQQELIKRSNAAVKELARAAKGVRHPMAAMIVASMQALTQAHATSGSEYKSGVRALQKLAAGPGSSDMAGFFLVYAHRRAHDYRSALKVAHTIEKRQPNSAMLKKMIGSCYQFSGDSERAISYYKQSTVLAPNDPSTFHGLGRAYLAAAELTEREVVRTDVGEEFAHLRFRMPR